ncbi:MAG: SRPBCC domain-containing protein [Chryseobacterium sp.]|nr:MAG: SRPBCC domain-containing protein [Chryseobacterium sp.]
MEKPFELEQMYDAPIEKVWAALSDENKMKVWYFPQLKEFKPIVGFEFKFLNDGSPYQKEWRVTKVINGSLLAHSWVYKGYHGTSEVSFELFEQGDKTKLKLTHIGLSSFPRDTHFARERFGNGWKQILGSKLRQFLAD